MNHLNLFNNFESKSLHHEDVLTRNFLLLLKNIPLVQIGFFELIRNTVSPRGINIESSALSILKLSEIYTQVDSNDNLFKKISDVSMLSIIISDDKLTTEHEVSNSDRHARYDGVIICDPSWVFIIENKPSVKNIWEEQLNPNINNTNNVTLIKEPCPLSWRQIISLLNELLLGNTLLPIERTMISEFIEYIDAKYGWLNPYNRFELCKANQHLLNKRCCSVLETYNGGTEVKYRNGWKHYIDTNNNIIQNIALDSTIINSHTWRIDLWMYAANVMSSARKAYEKINIDKLFALQENDENYTLATDFHFSFRSSGLLWIDSPLEFRKYLEYWKTAELKQIKREQFEPYFHNLIKNGLATGKDLARFKDVILSKNYPNLNICPGFLIKYTWNQDSATKLDSEDKFEEDFQNKVSAILSIFE